MMIIVASILLATVFGQEVTIAPLEVTIVEPADLTDAIKQEMR